MRFTLLASLLISNVAMAQSAPPQGAGPGPGGPPQMIMGVDYTPFFNAADTNGDKVISVQEWAALGIADRAYTLFEGSAENGLSLAEMNATGAFPGIDANGDKKITVKEFQDFDKTRRSAGPGGPPPANGPAKPN